MKRAFNLINFKGLSLKQIKPTFLKGDSLTLDEFERLYNQIKHGTELPTYFLAYRVIKDVNIANKKLQLVQTILTSLTYENLMEQMKAVYDSSGGSSSNYDIKEEKVFVS